MGRSKSQFRRNTKYQKQRQRKSKHDAAETTTASIEADTEHLFWPSQGSAHSKEQYGNIKVNGDRDEDTESDEDDEDEDQFSTVLDSIVKIHCTHSEPDYLIPWQKQHQSTSTSSGFVISLSGTDNNEEGNTDKSQLRIMTNAHSVEYGSIVQVQKRGQERKYEAIVEHIANECDLAILKILDQDDEPDFFGKDNGNNNDHLPSRIQPLRFSTTLPELQEEVEVLGYPTGGDSLSVTAGVVSRIEMQEYSQANTNLLAMQCDAAINPGNSGGPVVNEDYEVVGVAFQGLDEAQNIGYVVPVTVLHHLLHDIQRHKEYTGFCSLGVSLVLLQNKAFRKSLGMMQDGGTPLSGVMVKEVAPTAYSRGTLLPGDVILQVNGIPVANDGKVPFRPGERVSVSCYVQTKFKGDTVKLQVLRKGQILNNSLECTVGVVKRLIPAHFNDQPPPYLIVAGLVFTVLSIPYLQASGAWDEFETEGISYLLGKTQQPLERPSDQFVILSQVLAHRENLGYDKLGDLHLTKLNGRKIRSLAHLKSIVFDDGHNKGDEQPFLRLEFEPNNQVIVLERSNVKQATLEVCQEQSIQHSYFIPANDNGNYYRTKKGRPGMSTKENKGKAE